MFKLREMGVLAFFLGSFAAAALAQQPTVSDYYPQCASPGTLITVEGASLASVTTITMTFYGGLTVPTPYSLTLTPTFTSPTRLGFLMPTVGLFPPSSGTFFNPSVVVAAVNLTSPPTLPEPIFIACFESTSGVFTSVGPGAPQSTGQGAAVLDWSFSGGATPGPAPTPAISIPLANAIPNSYAILAASLAVPAPYPLFGGAPLVVSPAPIFISGLVPTGFGRTFLTFPVLPPGNYNVQVALQWGVLDFAAANIALSSALIIAL